MVELPARGVVVPDVSLDTDVGLEQAAVVLGAFGQQQVLLRLGQGGSDTARDDDDLGANAGRPDGLQLQWNTTGARHVLCVCVCGGLSWYHWFDTVCGTSLHTILCTFPMYKLCADNMYIWCESKYQRSRMLSK